MTQHCTHGCCLHAIPSHHQCLHCQRQHSLPSRSPQHSFRPPPLPPPFPSPAFPRLSPPPPPDPTRTMSASVKPSCAATKLMEACGPRPPFHCRPPLLAHLRAPAPHVTQRPHVSSHHDHEHALAHSPVTSTNLDNALNEHCPADSCPKQYPSPQTLMPVAPTAPPCPPAPSSPPPLVHRIAPPPVPAAHQSVSCGVLLA